MTRRFSLAFVCVVALGACSATPVVVPIPVGLPLGATPAPATDSVQTYAKAILNTLQQASFDEQREFCGYIYATPSGELRHTTPRRGTLDFCDYGFAPSSTVASFHTHGHFLPNYDSEIPSADDAIASVEIGFDDYLATPGGRMWVIGANGRSDLICGRGCLQSDPNYRADQTTPVDNSYSLTQLEDLQS